MRTLVTGGAGFIGSNLVDALVARGDEVAILDDLSAGKESNIADAVSRGAVLHVVDIRDAAAVQTAFAEAKPDVVFHLAAQADVRKSLEDPAYDATTNVVGTINVLEAARNGGAKRLVNTSTGGAIYGEVDLIPTPETLPALPMAAYGQSKRCAEEYCAWVSRLYGFSTVTLRYGNVYGPRQDPHGDAGVIAIFCGKALAAEQPIVFGDGMQTRDYIFVSDVVAANLLAADHDDPTGEYNIGTEAEVSVLDILSAFRKAAGLSEEEFSAELRPARLGELQRSALDATRARTELGFEAVTTLDDGIAETFAWAKGAAARA